MIVGSAFVLTGIRQGEFTIQINTRKTHERVETVMNLIQ